MDFRVIEDVGGERPLVATDDAGGGGGDNRSGTGDGGGDTETRVRTFFFTGETSS